MVLKVCNVIKVISLSQTEEMFRADFHAHHRMMFRACQLFNIKVSFQETGSAYCKSKTLACGRLRLLSTREPCPFTPKKVLVVSKVTLLNYEARKAFRKPWRRLIQEERLALTMALQDQGFQMQELIESHGDILHVTNWLDISALDINSYGRISVPVGDSNTGGSKRAQNRL